MKALNEFPITDYESLSTGVAQHSLSNNGISRKLYHIKKPLLQLLTYPFSLLQSIPKVPILLIRQIQELLPSRLDLKPIRRQLELPFRILALVYKIQR